LPGASRPLCADDLDGEERMRRPAEDHAVDRLQGCRDERIGRRVARHPLDIPVAILDVAIQRDADLQKQFGHELASVRS
jgi:hypothetical protein